MTDVKNKPRKGIYNNEDQGYKSFNNAMQKESGMNAYKQEEEDSDCALRIMYVSVTAVEDNSTLDMKF